MASVLDITKLAPGKKTYALVILALVSELALYAQSVLAGGFDLGNLLTFVNGATMTAALATIRMAFGKK
jgi:hypothetical protein